MNLGGGQQRKGGGGERNVAGVGGRWKAFLEGPLAAVGFERHMHANGLKSRSICISTTSCLMPYGEGKFCDCPFTAIFGFSSCNFSVLPFYHFIPPSLSLK